MNKPIVNKVKVGGVTAAPAADGSSAHQLVNTSAGELHYLCISTRLDPDASGKFAAASMVPDDRGLRVAHLAFIERLESAADYWDGKE